MTGFRIHELVFQFLILGYHNYDVTIEELRGLSFQFLILGYMC